MSLSKGRSGPSLSLSNSPSRKENVKDNSPLIKENMNHRRFFLGLTKGRMPSALRRRGVVAPSRSAGSAHPSRRPFEPPQDRPCGPPQGERYSILEADR